MNVGIDFVSTLLVFAAFALGNVRALSPRARYFGMTFIFVGIGLYRLKTYGMADINALVAAGAIGFGIYYAVLALRASR